MEELIGQSVTCPQCRAQIVVPGNSPDLVSAPAILSPAPIANVVASTKSTRRWDTVLGQLKLSRLAILALAIVFLAAWSYAADARLPWSVGAVLFVAAFAHVAVPVLSGWTPSFWRNVSVVGLVEIIHAVFGWAFVGILNLCSADVPAGFVQTVSEVARAGCLMIGFRLIIEGPHRIELGWPKAAILAVGSSLSAWLYVYLLTRPWFMDFLDGIVRGYRAGHGS